MKFTLSALVAVTASVVLAQDFNSSAPFRLQIQSDNDTLNGQYLQACHAGAAIEQLCPVSKDAKPGNYNTFTLNLTSPALDGVETGPLVWNLQTTNLSISSGLSFQKSLYSNIAVPTFVPGPTNDYVSFDAEGKLFIYSGAYNESTFVPGVRPVPVQPRPLYQWYVCYIASGYYYQSLAWSTFGEPINPTCQKVNVARICV